MIRPHSILILLLLLACTACSLTPETPITREQLMKTRIYTTFVINESPDEVLDALNKYGEVIIEAKRTANGKEYPVHVKLLATSQGMEVLDYDR